MRHTIFFDLDGTLLPLDMDAFFEEYHKRAHQSGVFDLVDRDTFGKAVYAMLENDGSNTNEACFFRALSDMTDADPADVESAFNHFYENGFGKLRAHTRMEEKIAHTIKIVQQKGYRLVLATQPLFPRIATNQRIAWAGLCPNDFEYISYYDNSCYCKPNPKYFAHILDHVGAAADECYMIGNDVKDDMSAIALGFEGFLVLDHAVGDIGKVPICKKGDYSDLLSFAESLPQI